MRELDRLTADTSTPMPADAGPSSVGVVGRGRLGTALAAALREAGCEVDGPAGRGEVPSGEAILLCVPDSEIEAAAATVAGAAPLVGHTSGATPLAALDPAGKTGAAAFGLHPLQTFSGDAPARFAGAGCAVAGSTPEALAAASGLARRLGMVPFEIADEDRAAYHAAASIASNFLVTLQSAAEAVAAEAGLTGERARSLLAPLVRTTIENWVRLGPERALTGPVARGDQATVARQRDAVAAAAPELLDLFDGLVAATDALARSDSGPPAPALRTVRGVAELRGELAPAKRAGRSVGLVPTMGAFHEGHLSLIRRARAECDVVVVSLFVNPAQFGPNDDLAAYPRNEAHDAALAEAEGVDVLFVPRAEEMYPQGFSSAVEVGGITEVLCGDPGRRGPEHFRGVTTVVTKLFNMVGPDVAYFGQKDAQQALVIRKLVKDLDMPVRIAVLPTVREPDGLAMSSRNAYLDAGDRRRAAALSRALAAAEAAVAAGRREADDVLAAARAELDAAGIEPEYLELRSADDLSPAARVNGSTLLAVAARVGPARLIDNVVLCEDVAQGVR